LIFEIHLSKAAPRDSLLISVKPSKSTPRKRPTKLSYGPFTSQKWPQTDRPKITSYYCFLLRYDFCVATNQWTRVGEGMRRNKTSRTIFANFRFKGKLFRQSLEATDKTVARNTLAELRRKLEGGPVPNQQNGVVSELAGHFLFS
jgi:hypothetical protein